MAAAFMLPDGVGGHLTAAVQFGFICGTLLFAVYAIADRFAPSKVFFWCAVAGAAANFGLLLPANNLFSLSLLRFFTGFCLAGIYPVGMKIAADYYEKGLGQSLSWLVGALVLGTAAPHGIALLTAELPWRWVIIAVSALSVVGGGLMLLLVPAGPFRKAGQRLVWTSFTKIFGAAGFKKAAFGYFGHMWELYTFWAFVPLLLLAYRQEHSDVAYSLSFWSFAVIAIGSLGCVVGGQLASRFGADKIARLALLLSGVCCACFPLAFYWLPPNLYIGYLLFWGMVVIADSPLFSALVAQSAAATHKATALTAATCAGFALTIVSIELMTYLMSDGFTPEYMAVLVVGPVVGLLVQRKK